MLSLTPHGSPSLFAFPPVGFVRIPIYAFCAPIILTPQTTFDIDKTQTLLQK